MRIAAVVLLSAVLLIAPFLGDAETRTGKLTGQVRIDGDAGNGGSKVYFYNVASGPPPSHDRYWRIPDFMEKLRSDGTFSVDLPPGEYCIAGISRKIPVMMGPPVDGDLVAVSLDESKLPRRYTVVQGETRDAGLIAGGNVFRTAKARDGLTGIEGTVVDGEGRAVEGAVVFAYTIPAAMGKPLFASHRSKADGKFLLRVHQGGTFYLKVRENNGDSPPNGAMPGGIKEEQLLKVDLKSAEIRRAVKLVAKSSQGALTPQ